MRPSDTLFPKQFIPDQNPSDWPQRTKISSSFNSNLFLTNIANHLNIIHVVVVQRVIRVLFQIDFLWFMIFGPTISRCIHCYTRIAGLMK